MMEYKYNYKFGKEGSDGSSGSNVVAYTGDMIYH